MKKIIFIIISFFLFSVQNSIAIVKIDITRGNLEPLPIAVSYFYLDNPAQFSPELKKLKLDEKISDVIKNNLTRSGLFNIIDPKSYIQSPKIDRKSVV